MTAATINPATVRNAYFHIHPRNFANECSIVRCETPEEIESAEAEGYERLTRDELRRHIAWVNGENDACGRPFGRIRLLDITARGWNEYRYGAGY